MPISELKISFNLLTTLNKICEDAKETVLRDI